MAGSRYDTAAGRVTLTPSGGSSACSAEQRLRRLGWFLEQVKHALGITLGQHDPIGGHWLVETFFLRYSQVNAIVAARHVGLHAL